MNDFVDDYDEYDELYGGREKITKKNEKNKNEENFQQSQRPVGWREGDSYIGRRKRQEIRVSDPFGREWVVPKEFVFYPL